MRLVYKQMVKQLTSGKLFLFLLFLLTIITSLSFFFVMFSVDGNQEFLESLPVLNEGQILYQNALKSNVVLAYNFFSSLAGLTSFVFVMFFYRFYRANRKQIGCLKAMGFKDKALRRCFVAFTAALSFTGAVLGMIGGYFLSTILIRANMETYGVTGLVKKAGAGSLLVGLAGSAAIFSFVAFLCYRFAGGKEPGVLLAGNIDRPGMSAALKLADKVSRMAPEQSRLSLRCALRKPVSILLIVVAVMSLNVCMILGHSLNISSGKVFVSQTEGHNYGYDTHYTKYQTEDVPLRVVPYLDCPAVITVGSYELEQTLTGLYRLGELFELKDGEGRLLLPPEPGTAYIGRGLSEAYGVKAGDVLTISVEGKEAVFKAAAIAANGTSATVYVNGGELAGILGAGAGAYNGVLSMEKPGDGIAVSKDERIEKLKRGAVSNQVSGVINQVTGVFVGAILLFLAVYVNFQDNTRDMLILHMMGYQVREIRRLLVDIYRPVTWFAFALTFLPSVQMAKAIQRSLSISTEDYMPFGINGLVIIITFISLNLIYWLVQSAFLIGVKRVTRNETAGEIIYTE